MSAWRAELRASVGELTLDVSLAGDARPVALVGPNGSGKTSILRMIAGVLRPEAAEVEVGGRVLASTAKGLEVPAERRGVGYVPQGCGLFPNLGVLDNVAFGLSVGERRPAAERHRIARQMLQQLGCEHLAERSVHGLSGGERQRVAVARALVTKPAILLLDEPLAALDAVARHSVRAFLAQHLRAAGCPSVVVTHEPRDVVALDAEVVVLDAGRVVQQGSLADLRRAPATEFAARFVAALGDGAPAGASPPPTRAALRDGLDRG